MSDSIQFVKDCFGKKLRVSLSDGRLIEGEFHCIDSSKSIILESAIEYYGIKEELFTSESFDDSYISRVLGSAILPGQYVKKIFLLK